jgi:hypothetical protein
VADSLQLVIVGGQSAGKPSLLQSLTDFPFPVGSGCCTRFAVRIVSRRTAPHSPNKVKITIDRPDFDVQYFNYPENTLYKDYCYEGETLGVDDFVMLMEEVRISSFMNIC